MFGKRYPNCVKKEEVEVTERIRKVLLLRQGSRKTRKRKRSS